jgi:hypothetical protein
LLEEYENISNDFFSSGHVLGWDSTWRRSDRAGNFDFFGLLSFFGIFLPNIG